MSDPPLDNSLRHVNVTADLLAFDPPTELGMTREREKSVSTEWRDRIKCSLSGNFRKNSGLTLLFGLTLLATFVFYFFFRVWQLNFIVELQRTASPLLRTCLQFVSDSKSFVSIGLPAGMVITSFFRNSVYLRKRAVFITMAIIISGFLSYGIKNALREPRPYEIDYRIEKLSGGGGFGFPSGHVAEAAALATTCIILWPNALVLSFVWAWAVLIMASRVYLGVHDIYQVLGGVLIGVLSSLIGYWALTFYRKDFLD